MQKRQQAKPPSRGSVDNVHGARFVPARVLAERDARYEASLRAILTAAILGDPPPGFSALDRRRAASPRLIVDSPKSQLDGHPPMAPKNGRMAVR